MRPDLQHLQLRFKTSNQPTQCKITTHATSTMTFLRGQTLPIQVGALAGLARTYQHQLQHVSCSAVCCGCLWAKILSLVCWYLCGETALLDTGTAHDQSGI
eukprot:GHRR01024024.1.p2 GENE.GHRR01024024.1~~GHRR01024024.1.p2  ORF type:complete len:101 (-),score=15.32 GHRR01024024.1:250-552(-)